MTKPNPWRFRDFSDLDYAEEKYAAQHRQIFTYLHGVLQKKQPASVLDIGCATGIGYRGLEQFDLNTISGVDYVPQFIEVFNERGMHGVVADIDRSPLPYPDGSFDMVICNSLLEHTLQPRRLVEEISRVLRPGGSCIVVVPNATSIRFRWDAVMGRNSYRALIDNLLHRSYLKRCSIFYSLSDVNLVFGTRFQTVDVRYFHKPRAYRTSVEFLLSLMSRMIPRFSDVFAVVLDKQPFP